MNVSDDLSKLYGICPYVTVQRLLAGKWRIMILYFLNEHKYRFNELSKRLSGVTQASLTKQLRSLEQAGLVERHVYMEIPPKVEYSLSELGKEFSKVLSAIQLFGTTYNQWLAEQKTDSDKAISG